MDIEKLQRITKLSKDLVDRGMATDIEQATLMADSMIDKDRSLTRIQETIDGVPMQRSTDNNYMPTSSYTQSSSIEQSIPSGQQSQQQGQFTQSNQQSAPQSIFNEGRDNQLRLQVSNMVMQLQEQTKDLIFLKSAVYQIKDEINRIEKQRKEHPAVMDKVYNQPQTSLHTQDIKKQDPHPKVGGFDPKDVAVENIFYSGPPK